MDYWSDVFNPDYQVPVFYVDPRDKDWFNENFQKRVTSKPYLDQFNNLYSYYTTNFGAGDADKDYVTNKNFIVFVYTHDYKANFGSIQIGAHEYTHDVQHSFDIWRTNEQLPCWVKEGQAMFFGLALSKSNLEDYLDLRYRFFQNTPEARTSLPQDPTNWVEFFTKGEANKHDCAAGGVYEAGALANEYLYSLKGKKGVVDLWKALETAPDFNTALKLAYGEDTSTLYPAFGRYIDSQLLELRKNINYR